MRADLSPSLRVALMRLDAMTAHDRDGVLAELDEGARQQIHKMLAMSAGNDVPRGQSTAFLFAAHGLSDWLLQRVGPVSEGAAQITGRSRAVLEECARHVVSAKPVFEVGKKRRAPIGLRSRLMQKGETS